MCVRACLRYACECAAVLGLTIASDVGKVITESNARITITPGMLRSLVFLAEAALRSNFHRTGLETRGPWMGREGIVDLVLGQIERCRMRPSGNLRTRASNRLLHGSVSGKTGCPTPARTADGRGSDRVDEFALYAGPCNHVFGLAAGFT